MNRRTLLSAISSGTIVGLAGCLSGIDESRSSESDQDALSWLVPRDDECVGAASLSELVERRFDDDTVSGAMCAVLHVENRRDEPITAVVEVDRPPRLWGADERPDSFERTLELDPGEGRVPGSFEPAPEVSVTVTIDDERLEDRWTGPPCYEHVLAIADDGLETDTRRPCEAAVGIENARDEPITAAVTVDADRPEPHGVDRPGPYEATFEVEPGDVEYDLNAIRPTEDTEITVVVDGEQRRGRWSRASCHPHVAVVGDDGFETDVRPDCVPPLVVENERDEPITATVDVDTERQGFMTDRADSEPFVETFDLAPGERAFEWNAFYSKVELDVTVTVDGEEFDGQWTDPACFAHAIAITDDGLEIGEVPTLNGHTDFSHDCFPGSSAPLFVETEAASRTVDVTIEDRCTETSTTETLEVDPDNRRRVSGLREGVIQEVTVDVHGGETATEEFWSACWGAVASIHEEGTVDLSPIPIY